MPWERRLVERRTLGDDADVENDARVGHLAHVEAWVVVRGLRCNAVGDRE